MKATQIQNGGLVPTPPRYYQGPTRPKSVRKAEQRKRKDLARKRKFTP